MNKKTLYFWLLLLVSVALSAVIISVFVKTLKLVLMAILILALAPVIFFVLKRLLMPRKKNTTSKLNK